MNPFGIFLIVATTLVPAYQLIMLPNIQDQAALFSQYLGLGALILMAWGQIMATRIKGMETVFGGLDQIYVLHKWAGIVALAAILLHDTIDADMEGIGVETTLSDIAETMGEISLYGLLVLVALSVATFVPYHLWKWTHKAMGALFAAGAFHFFFILKPFDMVDPAGLYTGVFCALGLLAYFWTLLPDQLRPSKTYKVTGLSQTGNALAISMKPQSSPIKAEPGQFGILSFEGAGLGEPHPFSFSKIEEDGSLRVTAKALGDFTSKLDASLEIDQEVRIQGPFGRFRHSGNRPEVWIAGGIGITPFLAWADALSEESKEVELFYCVRSLDDAPHLEEIQEIAARKPNLTLHTIVSSNGERLTTERLVETISAPISEVGISFCGPVSLRQSLQKGLRRYGVSPRNFQYEEFEFRTGIGLKLLARYALEKLER